MGLCFIHPKHSGQCDLVKSNCGQEPTDGKNFEFFIPSFGLKEHCHRYKLSYGPLHAGHTKGHIWGHDL